MKFKKRFLMCLAIVGVLLVPSMAKAGDAVPGHGWMRSAPDDNLANAATAGLRTDNNLRRNQTLYWAIKGPDAGTTTGLVIDTAASPPAAITCTVDGSPNCASAPLFISAQTAMICADSDLGSAGVDGLTTINMRICSDSTCADNVSIDGSGMDPGEFGKCFEFSGSPNYDGFNVGAMWVFLEVVLPPANDSTGHNSEQATTLLWIVGN